MALTDEQIDLLADHGDADELAAGLYTTSGSNHWQSHMVSTFFESTGEAMVDGENSFHDQAEVEAFYERITEGGENSNPDIQGYFDGMTMDDFGEMTSIEREAMVELRASQLMMNNRNPWEVLTLLDAVEDPDERAHLMRETFEHIEDLPMGFDHFDSDRYDVNFVAPAMGMDNMGTLLLLQQIDAVGEQVGPEGQAMLEAGVRLDLTDRRATEYAQDHVAGPLQENGGDWQATIDGLLQEEVYGNSLRGRSGDKISDNFQAVWQVGGPERITQMVETIGAENFEGWLGHVLEHDPSRLAIYEMVLAGTPYADVVDRVDPSGGTSS